MLGGDYFWFSIRCYCEHFKNLLSVFSWIYCPRIFRFDENIGSLLGSSSLLVLMTWDFKVKPWKCFLSAGLRLAEHPRIALYLKSWVIRFVLSVSGMLHLAHFLCVPSPHGTCCAVPAQLTWPVSCGELWSPSVLVDRPSLPVIS